MIDLTKLPPDDAERIAYAEGFTGVRDLFARISDLQHAAQHLLDILDTKKPRPSVKYLKAEQDALDQLRELLP
jgi:hypothetical protein